MLFSTVKTSSSLSNLCVFRIEAPNSSGEGYKILSEILELYKCLSWDENLKCIAHVASMMMVALLCANLISSLCILEARTLCERGHTERLKSSGFSTFTQYTCAHSALSYPELLQTLKEHT